MKTLPKYSFEEIQKHLNSYNFTEISIATRDYDDEYINSTKLDIYSLSKTFKLSGSNINLFSNTIEKINTRLYKEPKYIYFRITDPNKFINKSSTIYIKYHVLNNKLSNLLDLNYSYYYFLNNKKYFVYSKFDFFEKDNISAIVEIKNNGLEQQMLFNSKEFYNFEELLKIINNLIFL